VIYHSKAGAVSYSPCTVTMLYLASFLRHRNCFIPPLAFDAPLGGGGSRQCIAIPFGMAKRGWWGYLMVKEIEDIFSGVDRISACDRQTDRHLATA